jgi:multiple sugar transport system permease protein
VSELEHQRRQNFAGWLWISPWVIGFAAFLLLPMGMSLYYSLTDYPLLEEPVFVGAANYTRLFTDSVFLAALWKTALYAGISIPLCTVLSLVIAALLESRVKFAGFFRACVFVPTLVPMAASAMIWLWLLNGEHGLINVVLRGVGLGAPNWLTDAKWALPSLVLISLWGVGQSVITYVAALRQVPAQLYEAADLDGMTPLGKFFNVTAPMISPVILFNVITLTIGTLQFFTIPYVLTKATPGSDPRAMYFYTSYLYDNAFVYAQMGYASAMAWVQLLLTLGLTAAMFGFSRRAVYYRAG